MYRRGRWVRGQLLSIGTVTTGGPAVRLGLRTRRGLKGAAVRNRLKRQLRAIVHSHSQQLRSGVDLVVVLHPPAPPVTTIRLQQEFLALCKRLGIAS